MSTRLSRIASLAVLAVLVACTTDPTDDGGRDISELHQLHVTYDYPALATTQVSFWAVKGKASGADLWYHARAGATDSTKFVEFEVPPNALDRRPDGTPIATGDSVRITLTATDARHMTIAFEPSGLRFAATDRPTLRMFWVACGDDVNYDGKVDATDDQITTQLAVWRQEVPGAKWYQIGSAVRKSTKEVDALLDGFTGYAIMF